MLIYPHNHLITPNSGIQFHSRRKKSISALYSSLVAFWALDEASGDRADSINSLTVTDTNTVGSTTGLVYGTAADFVAANSERLLRADDTLLRMGDINWWFAIWFYLGNVTGTKTLFGKWNSNAFDYIVFMNGSTLTGIIGNGAAGQVATPTVAGLSASTWYLAVGWHDATANTFNLQVNDGTVSSASESAAPNSNTTQFNIGANASGAGATNYHQGRIGPLMLGKNYVPTSGDRTSLYNSGAGLTLAQMAAL